MRIVAWNCKGGLRRKMDLVSALTPEILIVSESEKISGKEALGAERVKNILWFGNDPRKGLAVVSFGEYTLEAHPAYEPRFEWIVPLIVSGPRSFLLFSVWTLPLGQFRSYVQPLVEAFEHYRSVMAGTDVVWAGDFNASVALDRPSSLHKFPAFLSLAEQNGLQSLYHAQRQCPQGEEPEKTYFHYHHADKGHFIDYVFATPGMHLHGFDISVGSHSEWAKSSDHMPVICDFHTS